VILFLPKGVGGLVENLRALAGRRPLPRAPTVPAASPPAKVKEIA
jgi:hypothetical protein